MSDAPLGQAEMVVRVIAQTAVDNEKYFCDLDAVVGDGDFGYSLARGFEVVLADWDTLDYSDIGGLLKKTAIILTKRIGGTSGPIWGTAFLRAGGALTDVPDPSGEQVIAAFRAAIDGIKQRGSTDLGDRRSSTRSSPRWTRSSKPCRTVPRRRSIARQLRRARAPRRPRG
jgi:phosphoenolpyruvate---glycerone phosphotransferase subunit DhaL